MKDSENQQEVNRRKSRRANRKNLEDARSASSKLGIGIIGFCVLTLIFALAVTRQVDARALPQPKKLSVDTLNLSALSTSWSCPISGDGTTGDTLVLANPDSARAAQVEVSVFDAAGVLVLTKKTKVNAGGLSELDLVDLGANSNTSIVVDSFASSIAVYRGLNLSDGPEFVACVNSLDSQADFPNLVTLRNSNSVLVLANPFNEAIVVDISATLIDISGSVPVSVFDEIRGAIIPAHGRVNLDLQKEFGRYGQLGVHVQSRSGFFAAETLMTYSGADDINGQTVVSNARDISDLGEIVWVGASPTRIAAHNNSANSHSLSIKSISDDNRYINGEPETVSAGATLSLTNSGAEYQSRTTVVSIEEGSRQASGIYASWIHASGDSVSGGSLSNAGSKSFIVPVVTGDQINLYNPSNSKVKIEISSLGSKKKRSYVVGESTYVAVPIADFNIEGTSILRVDANGKIFAGSSDAAFTRHSPALAVRK